MFAYVFKIVWNFTILENQLKKQAMSAAKRKRNLRKRKIELMNDDEKNEYGMKENKQRSELRRKQ